ncbi:hypothetical protein BDR26DRAFT_633350 [Obelidium mucronatum]|nr:hypothetical protein BDR26DRAFT_633350 [Obelidium mucronatum]
MGPKRPPPASPQEGRESSESRRTLQNRLAQRAYRARKDGKIKELELKLSELKLLIAQEGDETADPSNECNHCQILLLNERLAELQAENTSLSIMAQQQDNFARSAETFANLPPPPLPHDTQHLYRNTPQDDDDGGEEDDEWNDLINFDGDLSDSGGSLGHQSDSKSTIEKTPSKKPILLNSVSIRSELSAISSLRNSSVLIENLCELMMNQHLNPTETTQIIRQGLRIKYKLLEVCETEQDRLLVLHAF